MDKYKAKDKVLAKYKALVVSYQAKRKVKFQPPMPSAKPWPHPWAWT